ncbi:hypothetical protein HY641_01400 [Candidatus Woesearchaeota archaeon]|nr:hypothetical protein [Candidatus Woesearchaeota archaeon]
MILTATLAGALGAVVRVLVDPDCAQDAKTGYLPGNFVAFNAIVGGIGGYAATLLDMGSAALGLWILAFMAGYAISDVVDTIWYLARRAR